VLLDLSLFAHRAFSASLGVVLLSALTFAGAQVLIAQYLQTVLGLPPLRPVCGRYRPCLPTR
jgi:DHA2 family multidrug resistance protein-like MFS transporter